MALLQPQGDPEDGSQGKGWKEKKIAGN